MFYAGVTGWGVCAGALLDQRGGGMLGGWGRNSRGGDCASDFLCPRGADVVVHTLKQPDRGTYVITASLFLVSTYVGMLIRPSRAALRQLFDPQS